MKTKSYIHDPEFGQVTVRRSRLAKNVKLKIDQRGTLSISMPQRAPLFLARSLLREARDQVRKKLATIAYSQPLLSHGDLIGKTHKLVVSAGDQFYSRIIGTELHITLPPAVEIASGQAQQFIKNAALKALRTQAKAYLSRRLTQLAGDYDFSFTNIRFSNAGTRWGSCSSSGTISLNIWLMQLPFDLIDYVLIHELCHTKQMNHSKAFWQLVEDILPSYRDLRRQLKQRHP